MSVTTISLIIAFSALAVSITSVYFQFFHKKRKIYYLSLGFSANNKYRFGIANGGNHNVFLCGMSVNLKESNQERLQKFMSISPLYVKNDSLILPANEIQEFSLDIPNEIPKGFTPKVVGNKSNEYNTLDLSLFIYFAFPDGKRYSAEVNIGKISVRKDGVERGYSISDSFIDLTKISKRCD